MRILGLSCFYHDAAVAAVEDGVVRFAIQEERLSRAKHDARFPIMGVARALEACGWRIGDVDRVVFYEDPARKLDRLLDQVLLDWPRSWGLFAERLPAFRRFKLPIERLVRDTLRLQGAFACGEHHRSHAASAFFTSRFERAIVLTVDGVGERETTVAWLGEGNRLRKLGAIHFPDSLGLFYSVFTQYLGFEVNEGEYKVMGLASFGKPRWARLLRERVIALAADGSFRLARGLFDWSNAARHHRRALARLLGVPPRAPGEPVGDAHRDLAASVQQVLEDALLGLLRPLLERNGCRNVCMAGGVALNCTANSRLVRELGIRLHVHPAAGDAGGALGAALDASAPACGSQPYRVALSPYLGVDHGTAAAAATLRAMGVPFDRDPATPAGIARALAAGRIVAVWRGRDEWGPRALGNRSILADPRSAAMQDHLNERIKFREEFRPFAPVVLAEYFGEYFDRLGMAESPHMLFTFRARRPDRIPAAVHVDGTSRVQTVTREQNPFLYAVIDEFHRLTGVPVLINTSFNVRGEPMVSSPADALRTFFGSGIDALALGDCWVEKAGAEAIVPLAVAGASRG